MLLALVFACAKDDKQDETVQRKSKVQPMVKPEIVSLEISPAEPHTATFVRVIPKLKNPRRARFVRFSYQWYIGGVEVVSEGNNQVLGKGRCRKGDKVYCIVQASMGKLKSKKVRSDKITIGNAPPIISSSPIEPFEVPGEMTYRIEARDPDGDMLSYTLVSPLDRGIELDQDTGEIRWYISQLPSEAALKAAPPAPARDRGHESQEGGPARSRPVEAQTPRQTVSNVVEIFFEVRDDDGASAKSSIIVNLEKGGDIPM